MPRRLGRAVKTETDPATGVTVAYFEDGLARRYSQEEITGHVLAVAEQVIDDPGKVDEAWYEFLHGIVGEEAMATAIAVTAQLKEATA